MEPTFEVGSTYLAARPLDQPLIHRDRLLELSERFGRPVEEGVMVAHDLTQEELAQLVGASRETVNKALADFASRNWIRLESRSVTLTDVERLQKRGVDAVIELFVIERQLRTNIAEARALQRIERIDAADLRGTVRVERRKLLLQAIVHRRSGDADSEPALTDRHLPGQTTVLVVAATGKQVDVERIAQA